MNRYLCLMILNICLYPSLRTPLYFCQLLGDEPVHILRNLVVRYLRINLRA